MARKMFPSVPSAENAAFWAAAEAGTLMVPKCKSCGKSHWYPRALCPHCFSDDIELIPSKGTGTIYSWSHMPRAPEPFTIAYVTLAEGVTVLTNLVDCDPTTLKIGQSVKLAWQKVEGGPQVWVYTPA